MIKVLTKGMCHFPPPCPLTTKAIAMLKEIRYRHTAYVKENSHNGANRIDLNASGMSLVVRKIRAVACSPAIAWPTVNPRATASSPIHDHANSKSTRGILHDAAAPDHSAMLIAATRVQYRGPLPEIDWPIPVEIQKNTNVDLDHVRLARGSGRMSSLLYGVECGLAKTCAIASRVGQEIRLDQRVALPKRAELL